ncbi:TIGR01440 family protein [Neobacillus terrae]|uniref:TIGR01440 family protein n=1 Tax=Neobacillus terrae TaxID=3034837 RepID=UPI00140B845E|nr:TIGR01440 family protein [Neobacillus terrae]NHM30096.1 TIGR01440 family protein [Neobacillus terrae]
MAETLEQWEKEFASVISQFKEQADLKPGALLVVGCSTSEVIGEKIGTAGTFDVAEMIFRQLKKLQEETGVELAFQCCEHLNRALVVESRTADTRNLEAVSVIPVRNAGGAMGTFAYEHMENPSVVEFLKAEAGIDIGDTFIGMHLKHVAVPVRIKQKSVGGAHVTLAKTRPKLIGGERAVYEKTNSNQACH